MEHEAELENEGVLEGPQCPRAASSALTGSEGAGQGHWSGRKPDRWKERDTVGKKNDQTRILSN